MVFWYFLSVSTSLGGLLVQKLFQNVFWSLWNPKKIWNLHLVEKWEKLQFAEEKIRLCTARKKTNCEQKKFVQQFWLLLSEFVRVCFLLKKEPKLKKISWTCFHETISVNYYCKKDTCRQMNTVWRGTINCHHAETMILWN